MSDLYLIAHKVRGEPAFDIAEHMTCPKCAGQGWVANADTCEGFRCDACDEQGHWWIIPTSGHRAFPYWDIALCDVDDQYELNLHYHKDLGNGDGRWPPAMPPSLRDHYTTEREAAVDLVKVLGIIHAPLAPIKRRF